MCYGAPMAEIVLTLRPGADPARVREELARAGVRSPTVLGELGLVTGDMAPEDHYKLAAIDGVEAIEEGAPVQLPPPESPIQ
jgi:hypothetical protein